MKSSESHHKRGKRPKHICVPELILAQSGLSTTDMAADTTDMAADWLG